jgi:hypothetical protein
MEALADGAILTSAAQLVQQAGFVSVSVSMKISLLPLFWEVYWCLVMAHRAKISAPAGDVLVSIIKRYIESLGAHAVDYANRSTSPVMRISS